MAELLLPPALVTVLTVRPWGAVELERFEVPYKTRPVYLNGKDLYSVETHRPDVSISAINRSAAVDVATWLHRCGVWDTVPTPPDQF